MTDRRDNSTRTKARKRALDVLYESELRGRPAAETLAERIGLAPVRPFTIQLVNGCIEHAPCAVRQQSEPRQDQAGNRLREGRRLVER